MGMDGEVSIKELYEYDGRMIFISTQHEVTAQNKLCKVRRIKVKNFEKIMIGQDKYKIIVRMTPYQKNTSKIFIDDSELTRIIKHLNPNNNGLENEHSKYEYIKDLISVKVGKSGKYRWLIEDKLERKIENIGEIEIHNYKYDEESKSLILESVETFVHLISNASHIRSQKALFVKKALFEAVDEILRCGVSPDAKTKQITKWTSYYGLQASNSVVVSMPKCTIIPDKNMKILDKVDVVYQDYRDGCNANSEKADKFQWDVSNNQEKYVPTCPFDGMGIVDVPRAEQWAKDLGLDYVPGSFQIRLCGVKGCLFVMSIDDFISDVSKKSSVEDIDGNIQDYANGDFDVILTESMFKYGKFYDEENKVVQWKREFHKECHGYKRTFNICSYASKYSDLKDEMLTAYQPLQTQDELFAVEEEKKQNKLDQLCGKTVEVITSMYSDISAFLKYIGIKDEDEINKESVKPYYRALAVNHSLCNDKYIRMKMEKTLERAKEKAYVGKLYVDGNYTVVGSDPFALLQHAFGMEVTGLLEKDEIYSNYWNQKEIQTVNIWRNPHIYREHWIGKCINNGEVNKWFKYLDANIIVSILDTNLLRANSADCDGDVLASCKNEIFEEEIRKLLNDGKARTILPNLISERENQENEVEPVKISDVKVIIESELHGFSNDIGKVINKISELWGEKQNDTTEKYIKILSVVGSLVIDFAKTGVKVPIPKEITKYISDNCIKKLRFMMYLPNNKKLRKKEERTFKENQRQKDENEKKGLACDEEFVSRFSDKECTLNEIMKYMKKKLEGLEISIDAPAFHYSILIISRDKNLGRKTQYAQVRDLFKNFVKEQKQISDEKRDEEKKNNKNMNEEYGMIYKAFYEKCRNNLLCIFDKKGKPYSKSMILDCCIVCCYTEFKEENYSHFDLLWNLFPEELVKRASCQDIASRKNRRDMEFEESLERMRNKSNVKYEALKNTKKDKIPCLECDSTPDLLTIYKSDIKQIKEKIPTSVNNYKSVRKVYACYFVASKRLESMNKLGAVPCLQNSKNDITCSCIGKLTKLDDRQVKKAIDTLEKDGLIEFQSGDDFKICKLKFVPTREEIDVDKIVYNGFGYMSAFRAAIRCFDR